MRIFLLIFAACAVVFLLLFPGFAAAGSQTYTTPGTYSFTVPAYGSLTVQVWGAGGAGGSWCNNNGASGGASSFNGSIIVYGGIGGIQSCAGWTGGAGGSASGGDTNTTGSVGADGFIFKGGAGGNAPNGGSGGSGGSGGKGGSGSSGTAPGAGGGGAGGGPFGWGSGGGGSGGYSSKIYASGALIPSASISVVVGSGGALGTGPGGIPPYSGGGARGQVSITWTDPPPPTCSVWADTNPIAYDANTKLRWTSANANTSFYITNVGYVTPNQTSNTSVGPLATTAYNGTAVGAGGTTACNFTLTVNPPANCTFNGATVNHGDFVTAYQSPSVPYNQTCNSEQRVCTNGNLSGNYNHTNCTVSNPPPVCALSLNPTSITQGQQSSTLSWTSANATSCTGDNFSTGSGSPTSGSTSVSPSQSTTYTASCTRPGSSTAECTGTGAGGIGALLTVTCTPSYTCTGVGSQQTITYTDAACATSSVTTCVLPEFCATGSAVCLYEAPTGSIFASPRLVPSGNTSQISWSTNAESCTVSGNGNTWTGISGVETSNPITGFTTYTLECDDADADTVEDDLTDSVNIYRVPSWLEV